MSYIIWLLFMSMEYIRNVYCMQTKCIHHEYINQIKLNFKKYMAIKSYLITMLRDNA